MTFPVYEPVLILYFALQRRLACCRKLRQWQSPAVWLWNTNRQRSKNEVRV